jgi:hypothetical protein
MKRPAVTVSFGSDADFGAVQRGIPVPGQPAGTVVIPPGRYWLDTFGDKRQVLTDWFKGKPEVHVETTEEDLDSSPPRLFTIFTVPKGVNNFNLEGVWFPTTQLGFPTIADTTVQSSDDTVQRPPPPTITDVLQDAATTTGKVTGSLFANISTGTIIKFALIGGAVILVATLPGKLLRSIPRHV